MGLDMYLSARRCFYASSWGDQDSPEHKAVKHIRRTPGAKFPPSSGNLNFAEIKVEVAYWRKANQIHNWFVQNVQNGVDDCGNYYVEVEQLATLRDLCREVLKASQLEPAAIVNGYSFSQQGEAIVKEPIIEDGQRIVDPIPASELLPATEGFFFGGTEYDQYYYGDVKETEEKLTQLINWAAKDGKEWEFEYHSSW